MVKQRTVVWLLLAVLIVPGIASAKYAGRLIGKVMDPEGNVLQDVTISATCKTLPTYKDSDTTDKKGMFTIDFPVLDQVYAIRFEKNGFQTLQSEQMWELAGKTRLQFTLYPGESSFDGAPLASTSNDAIYAFNLGVAAYNDKDYATAIVKFKESLDHDAELHQSWAALAKIYVTEEQFQLAVEASEKAIELGSTDQNVWQSRYEAYRSLGNEDKAAEVLKELEDQSLKSERAKEIHNEAVALVKAGDNEAAYNKFMEALELDPNLNPSLVGAATTAVDTGRHQEATEMAARILATDPSNEQAIRIRYNAALQTGDNAIIVDALVSLAAVEPVIARDALLKLAFDSYDANTMDDAKSKFGKVLQVDPSNELSHYYLALIYVNEDANDEAKQHLREYLRLAPEDKPERVTASQLLEYLESQ